MFYGYLHPQVTCTQHIFEKYVAFQYQCTNTIEEQILEDVSVVMDLIEGEDCFAQIASVELKSMPLARQDPHLWHFSEMRYIYFSLQV